jgi:hypothetical protein
MMAWCCGGAVGCSGSGAPADTLSAAYEQLELEIFGGYGPEPCRNGKNTYEVTRVPGQLTWTGCDNSKSPPEAVMGDRALSDAEIESVTKAFAKVYPSSAQTCNADNAVWTLDVTTSSGVKLYGTDFCPGEAQAGRTFVTGLGYLANLLVQLAQ